MLHGIDVSAYQLDLDFSAVDGDFVFVKATGGPGYTNQHFTRQVREAHAAGFKVGAYHFARDGWSGTTADEEAVHFLRTINGLDVFPVLDWEDPILLPDVGWAEAWLKLVRADTGKTPLLYCNKYTAEAFDWSRTRAMGVKLWLALYGDDKRVEGYQSRPAPQVAQWGTPALWQYTQHGRLPGYAGDLDLNVAYEDPWGSELLIPDLEGINK